MSKLSISERAAAQVRKIQKAEGNDALMLRITVSGGGCSGFQYSFSLDANKSEDDLQFECFGVNLVTDQTSLDLLAGSEIDYVEEMVGSAFVIKNPNASSSCGCGNSFSI